MEREGSPETSLRSRAVLLLLVINTVPNDICYIGLSHRGHRAAMSWITARTNFSFSEWQQRGVCGLLEVLRDCDSSDTHPFY